MWLLMIVLHSILFVLYVAALAVRSPHSTLSDFELHRRARFGDMEAKKTLHQTKAYQVYVTLRPFIAGLIGTLWVYLGIVIYSMSASIAIAGLGIVVAGAFYQRTIVIRASGRMFGWIQQYMIKISTRFPKVISYIQGTDTNTHDATLGSREELVHILERSHTALDEVDRRALLGVLGFSKKTVGSIMIPKKQVATIKKSEILGPLVLDELHKTGHTCFPVTDREGGKIVGFLDIEGLMQIQADARSSRVETRMDARVHMIAREDTLDRALIECIEGRQTMLIVVNSSDEMVGILTLGDIIGELLGSPTED